MLVAEDIMTKKVVTVTRETSVKDLALTLAENNISGAPVVDENRKLVGIVTESDLIAQRKKVHLPTVVTILDSFFYLESHDRLEQEVKKIAGTTVADIYCDKPVSISKDTKIEEIATIMSEKRVHTLPVIDEDRTILGVVGKKDIIKTLI